MRSAFFVRFAKWANLIVSLCLCALGAAIIALPTVGEGAVRFTHGALMVLTGAFKIIGYFSKDLYRLAFQYDLQLGTVIIALGIVALARPGNSVGGLCVIFGAAILIDSIFKIKISVEAKKFGLKSWPLLLALAVVVSALGVVLMLRPTDDQFVWLSMLGGACIADGILNFIQISLTVKVVKNQRRDDFSAQAEEGRYS